MKPKKPHHKTVEKVALWLWTRGDGIGNTVIGGWDKALQIARELLAAGLDPKRLP